MKAKLGFLTAAMLLCVCTFWSCEKEDDDNNETKISAYNETESHKMGQNCMTCHMSGGTGEGWFNIAGTVYDSLKTNTYPNATVRLYTGANGTGTLKYTIEVDANGNFFTTESIDFSSALYPSVQGSTTTQFMGSSITMGQCNSCHGQSTDKIWTK
jgi:hypothetical protein